MKKSYDMITISTYSYDTEYVEALEWMIKEIGGKFLGETPEKDKSYALPITAFQMIKNLSKFDSFGDVLSEINADFCPKRFFKIEMDFFEYGTMPEKIISIPIEATKKEAATAFEETVKNEAMDLYYKVFTPEEIEKICKIEVKEIVPQENSAIKVGAVWGQSV